MSTTAMEVSATLPAQLIHVAAQFTSKGQEKEKSSAIRVRPAGETGVIIESCDGHRAFRVACPDSSWHCSQPLLIDPKPFAKKMPYAIMVNIRKDRPGQAEILIRQTWWQWHRQAALETTLTVPYVPMKRDGEPLRPSEVPDYDRLWPDQFTNSAGTPICLNARLLADFLSQVERYSVNNVVVMRHNNARTPLAFTAEYADTFNGWLKNVQMEFMLMPSSPIIAAA